MSSQTPVIRRGPGSPAVTARAKPNGRSVTSVPYSLSFERPDEGATNGRLTEIQAVRSQAQPGAAGPSLSLAMGLTVSSRKP
jgi:hypothetical protein